MLYWGYTKYRGYTADGISFEKRFFIVKVYKQVVHAKECWNSAHYAESVRNVLCALNKCNRGVLSIIDKALGQQHPVLSQRHTVFGASEALGTDTEEFYEADHWV